MKKKKMRKKAVKSLVNTCKNLVERYNAENYAKMMEQFGYDFTKLKNEQSTKAST